MFQTFQELPPPDNASSRHETSPLFVRKSNFSLAKNLFQIDKEIFFDPGHPGHTLVLVHDSNTPTVLPLESDEKRPETYHGLNPQLSRRSESLKKSASLRKKCTLSENEIPDHRLNGTPYGQLLRLSTTLGHEEIDIFKPKDKEKQPESMLKILLRKKLKAIWFNLIMSLMALYALFSQDLLTAIFTKSADIGFDIVSLIALVAFVNEMMLLLYVIKEYRFSLFFWLDLISTVSIVLDINLFTEQIFYSDSDFDKPTQSVHGLSPTGSIEPKITQVLRIMRLFRLIKCYKQIMLTYKAIKCWKATRDTQRVYPEGSFIPPLKLERTGMRASIDPSQKHQMRYVYRRESLGTSLIFGRDTSPKKEKKNKFNLNIHDDQAARKSSEQYHFVTDTSAERTRLTMRFSDSIIKDESRQESPKELRVGKKLVQLTARRTVGIVLFLLILVPFMSDSFYSGSSSSHVYQMSLISSLLDSNCSETAKQSAVDNFIQQFKQQGEYQLVYFAIGDSVLYSLEDLEMEELRRSEDQTIYITTKTRGEIMSKMSFRRYRRLDALLNIGRTCFVLVLLAVTIQMFHRDIKQLLLIPLERMISKVNKIASDPLLSKEEKFVRDLNPEFRNEAIQIENAIIKIGGLLALGFGEAGSSIIKQNITTAGDLNPMLPGKKRAAIYGFCDIRNFTDVTEILQEDVMIFVNSIADIVHSTVDKYGGAANKNIGDAFLIVWMLPEEAAVETQERKSEIVKNKVVENYVDCALISFLKMYARVNRDPTLLKYSKDARLSAQLPNYKVKMGFGLHIGWSVEGAIGSYSKIDVSYLSPNVNMASRLEAATKQYGVPLLFSGEIFEMLSDSLQEISRMVDVVTVKGSANPIELYTVNLDADEMSLSSLKTNYPTDMRRKKHRTKKEYIRSLVESGLTYTLLEADKDVRHMLRNKNKEFDNLFHVGFSAYIDGEWAKAKKNFDACLEIKKEDGPTRNLGNFMAEYDYIAPEGWNGCRILTDK